MKPLLLILALIPAIAHADGDIIVTGQGLDPAKGDAAYDRITIDRDTLLQSASGRLEDALRDAAGFQQFRRSDARSAHPTSQGASLRGLGGNASSRALVLLDGVPLADPFGGWINWSAIDLARLSSVEITRGGGSGSAGPGALAGTIALQSLVASADPVVEAEALYGSHDSVDARALAAGQIGSGHVMLSAHYARGDGFVPIIASQRGPADVAAPYEQASLAGRAVFPVGEGVELQANGLLFTDDRTRGTAFTANQSKGADASLRLVGRGAWNWEASTWIQSRDFASQFASVNAARTTSTLTLDQYSVPATGLGARFELSPPLGEHAELRLGGDLHQNEGQTREHYLFTNGVPANGREAGGRTRTAGAFADLTLQPTDTLTLTGGGRIDRWWIENGFLHQHTLAGATLPGTASFADRSGTETSGRAGIAWQLTDTIKLRSAAYLGWRLPTLNELYRPFRVGNDATAANPLLSPERLKGIDAGFDWRPLPGLTVAATAFLNQLDNAITNVTLSSGPAGTQRKRQNVDAVRSQGVELEANYVQGPWSFGLDYAYVDARVHASGAAAPLNGLRPAQTPKHQASAHLGWSKGERTAALVVRYVARQFEDDQNSRSLADAVTLDASLAWPVWQGLSLVARAENITDTRVEATISSANIIERATPQSFWLGLRYRL